MIKIKTLSVGLLALALSACASSDKHGHVPPTPQDVKPAPSEKNVPLDPTLQAAARQELLSALSNSDPFLRCNAIEGLSNVDAQDAEQPILHGLDDSAPSVRFTAALAAGHLQLKSAYPRLLKLADDPNRQVQIGVRYALHKLGDTHLTRQLETFAVDPDLHVRGTTAQVLGLLGEPSATNMLLRLLQDHEPSVRIQAAEALWRLGNEEGLEKLVAYTISGYSDDQVVAVLALAEPRDQRVEGHIQGALTSDYPEVSLAAARGLGMLGSDEGWHVAVDGVASKDPRQRLLAAMAMGAIGRSDLQPNLRTLLKDDQPSVRIAAATAILQLRPPPGQ